MIPDLPNLKAIRVFEAAARHVNFSRAADELNVTQSAVSRQIQQLEAQLGRPLFQRRGPQVTLTPAGREYFEIVQEGLALIRRGTARLFRTQPSPFLTLSLLPSFASKWLVPRVAALEQALPGVALRLASSYELVDFESDTDVDAAIRYGKGQWPGVAAGHIIDDVMFPVCSPVVAERLSSVDDLMTESLLVEDPVFDEWKTWAEAAGVTVNPKRLNPLSVDFNIQIQAATAGQGIALGRALLVADDLRAGRLVCPFPIAIQTDVQYYFVCPPERVKEPALRGLFEWLKTAAAETVEGLERYYSPKGNPQAR